jgi:putative transposase
VQAGQKPGYPRFQGRASFKSFTYKTFTYPQVRAHGGARLDNGFLVLSKIGRIAVGWSRPLEGTPKTITVVREADGWYVAVSCADVPMHPLPPTGRETGIDVGLKVFLVTAQGEVVENPRHFRKTEQRLAKAQRRVSRRRKGSNRRKKAVVVLAKAYQAVKRQRADHHHKTALALIRQYDTIYHEAIQPANLSRRPAPLPNGNGGYGPNGAARKAGLNTGIRDAGWGRFLSILACKPACAGKRVEAVNPAYTSQDCSGCGVRVPKGLRVRTHVCPACGLVLDRDENATRTIQRAGQARQGAVAVAAVVN